MTSNDFKISMQSQTYIPLYVYKAFLKMALSILPKIEIDQYRFAFRYLLGDNIFDNDNTIHRIEICESDITYLKPMTILFKRKQAYSWTNFPLHTFCLYFMNYMFQIYFPFHEENILQAENNLAMRLAPYALLNPEKAVDITVNRYFDELQSSLPTKRNHSMGFKFDEHALKNLKAVKVDLPDEF